MPRKLSNDVSIQEMQQMRDDGMSNAEIAEQLDVCVDTVRKYLGKQPAGMRRARRTSKQQVCLPPPAPAILFEEPEPEPEVVSHEIGGLRVVSRIMHLESSSARYMISNNVVKITSRDVDMPVITLTKDELDGVVAELLEVLDMM